MVREFYGKRLFWASDKRRRARVDVGNNVWLGRVTCMKEPAEFSTKSGWNVLTTNLSKWKIRSGIHC